MYYYFACDQKKVIGDLMGETTIEDAAAVNVKAKPTIVVPQRGSMESLFTNGLSGLGFSPGPMTLVAGFFAEQGGFSFSQLLAGAMVSPIAAKAEDEKGKNVGEDSAGYKRNLPVNLAVAQPQLQVESLSPLFKVPPLFSPSGLLNSPGFFSPIQSPFGMSHQQALAHVTAQATFSQMQGGLQHSATETPPPPPENPSTAPAPTESLPLRPESLKVELSEVSQSERKAAYGSCDKPASDGYNWRKYGQKQVKASECPRSYYKCTHLNCPVKKKVERSADGRISEITYKGHHNHDPPQTRRGKELSETVRIDSDSESLNQNNEREGNVIVIGDGDDDDDEPLAKRRTMDAGHSTNPPLRQTITDSKIVVQTRSEVDLLDDGYKWRKYGQKVVKGNPHPRSYYKCTFAGCNVRKHVERSSADPKAVITTYEGKHNHEIPMGRYSNQQVKANRNHLPSASEMDIGNKDHQQQQRPLTLHLKEEQIAA